MNKLLRSFYKVSTINAKFNTVTSWLKGKLSITHYTIIIIPNARSINTALIDLDLERNSWKDNTQPSLIEGCQMWLFFFKLV